MSLQRGGLSEARNATRAAVELVSALILMSLAALAFAWSTLGLWRPSGEAKTEAQSSLIFYSNFPKAPTTGLLSLSPDKTGSLTGIVDINLSTFDSKTDASNYRWALVGTGSLRFEAALQTKNAARQLLPNFTAPPPEAWTSSCKGTDKAQHTSNKQTILVGGLANGFLLGTNKYDELTVGSFIARLRFPRLHEAENVNDYSLRMGAVGQPTADDDVRIGYASFGIYPSCLNFGTGQDVGHAGEMTASPVAWHMVVGSKAEGDALKSAEPQSTGATTADWKFTHLIHPQVTHTSQSLERTSQGILFAAGILAGLATAVLLQGLTRLFDRTEST